LREKGLGAFGSEKNEDEGNVHAIKNDMMDYLFTLSPTKRQTDKHKT
jgi:hypothetical protein